MSTITAQTQAISHHPVLGWLVGLLLIALISWGIHYFLIVPMQRKRHILES
ncbi:MAG: hypothetical protein HQL97_14870, partial [Magnetococcales bacterium]|nr:hypothetical protein [Magnetococcales bacterium]